MADLESRDMSLDDRDAALDLRHRSFGPMGPDTLSWWNPVFEKFVAGRRALGVYDGGLLVATGRIHDYRQLWGGRAIPMAGVAGVMVAPERRGHGVATLLMNALLTRAIELGDVVSVLFPAAMAPYRRIGFEIAGLVMKTTFPSVSLRALGAPTVAVRRPTTADAEEIAMLMRRAGTASLASGPLEQSVDAVRKMLDDSDNICYAAADGVLVYAWDDEDVRVERLVAESAETTRALWATVGSGASYIRNVYTYQPLHDPIHLMVDDEAKPEVEQEHWMLRILDARQAVAQRGFPLGVTAEVPLWLEDPWFDGCSGAFRLRVSEGSGELLPDAGPEEGTAVRLGPNGLAALYAGTPMWTIRSAGLVSGGTSEQHAILDAIFASRPYLIDSF